MFNALRGLDVVLSCRHRNILDITGGYSVGDDAPTAPAAADEGVDNDVVVEDFEGFTDAVTELVGGVEMNQITPYLSAFASGFGAGGSATDAKAAEAARAQAEEMKKQETKRSAASKSTTLWVVLGTLGAAAVGTGVYFFTRKK